MGHHSIDDQRAGRGLLGKCRLSFRGVAEVIGSQRARVRVDVGNGFCGSTLGDDSELPQPQRVEALYVMLLSRKAGDSR